MTEKPHLMLIEARFYPELADELVRGAIATLDREGVTYERAPVPGAFEIPAAIRYAIRSRDFFAARRRFDGYVALGCVIRGETSHYDYVCRESARALQNLVVEFTLAVGYGILTVENEDQAWARAAVDKGNKGGQAAETCLAMIDLKRQFNLFPR